MSKPARRTWWLALRVTMSALLVGYLAVSVDLARLADSLATLDLRCWLVAAALYAASQLVSSYRWGQLARAVGFVESDTQVAAHYFAGAFVNLALPSSLGGDALRALRLAQGGRVSDKLLAGCTVAVDRLTGLSALLLLGVIGLLTSSQGWGAGALAALTFAALALHVSGVWPALRMLPTSAGRWGFFLEKLAPYVERPRVLARAAALSWVVQLLNIATVVWLGAALGLSIPLATYFVAVPAVALLAILPLSISGLGARELGLAWLLPITAEQGVSLGLLWFSVVLTTGALGGLPFLLTPVERGSEAKSLLTSLAPAELARRGLHARMPVS